MFSTGRDKLRVWTRCPITGTAMSTGAEMTVREFERFSGVLVMWCPACKSAHSAAKADLWQELGSPWGDAGTSRWRRLWQGGDLRT